jgi:YesN/AraC family two-component response regulator
MVAQRRPAGSVAGNAAVAAGVARVERGGKRMAYKVLIVDDSKLARMSIARLLNMLRPDWVQIEATNAVDAIKRHGEDSIDLVLLDFNMPGRDGLALAADLRALSPTLPMALISANSQDEIVARTRALGAEFLLKPLTEAPLAAFLASLERSPPAPAE